MQLIVCAGDLFTGHQRGKKEEDVEEDEESMNPSK